MEMFQRWCLDPSGRTPVAVNPDRVDCLEEYGPAFRAATGEDFPAATRIVMKGKQEYIVQGTVAETTAALSGKAYVVQQQYMGHSTKAVFANRRAADDYAAQRREDGKGDCWVEEYELLSTCPPA